MFDDKEIDTLEEATLWMKSAVLNLQRAKAEFDKVDYICTSEMLEEMCGVLDENIDSLSKYKPLLNIKEAW